MYKQKPEMTNGLIHRVHFRQVWGVQIIIVSVVLDLVPILKHPRIFSLISCIVGDNFLQSARIKFRHTTSI